MNDANINVLAERVDSALIGFSEIKGMITGMTAAQQNLTSQIAVFQERMAQVHLTQQRLNNIMDEQGERIDKVQEEQKRVSEELSGQKLMWRLVGGSAIFVATCALGLVSWSFQRMDGMNSILAIADRRLAIIEFGFGMRNTPPPNNFPVQPGK